MMEGDPGFRSFAERCEPPEPSVAQDQREVVIRAARLACASYPHTEAAPRSDIDHYMAQLRDELALLDKEREA